MKSDRGYRWWMLLDRLFTLCTPVVVVIVALAALGTVLFKTGVR